MQVVDKNGVIGHQKAGLGRCPVGGKTGAVVPKTDDHAEPPTLPNLTEWSGERYLGRRDGIVRP